MNNALDLYLHLKKWTDVIECYQSMKKLSLVELIVFCFEKEIRLNVVAGWTCHSWTAENQRNAQFAVLIGRSDKRIRILSTGLGIEQRTQWSGTTANGEILFQSGQRKDNERARARLTCALSSALQYEKACEHLVKAVEINSLQVRKDSFLFWRMLLIDNSVAWHLVLAGQFGIPNWEMGVGHTSVQPVHQHWTGCKSSGLLLSLLMSR